jgi:hypothetical protein
MGNVKAVMNYCHYEEDIVLRYGVVLKGWTYDKFVNPSKLSTSIPPLTKLYDVLKSGVCKFIKLMLAEKKEHEVTYQAKLKVGEVQGKKQKVRSDVGISRKKAKTTSQDIIKDKDNENEGKDNGDEAPQTM